MLTWWSLAACGAAPSSPSVTALPPTTAAPPAAPTKAEATALPPTKPVSVKVLAVDIELTHACALTEQRRLRCWGENKLGQLGYGDTRSRLASEADDVPLPGPVDSFAVDPGSTCAVVKGSVYCWGNVLTNQGSVQIGDDEAIASAGHVPFARPVVAVALGWNFACLIDDRGEVTCWGGNDRFQLGACPKAGCRKSPGMPDDMNPVKLGFKATALTLGYDHTCALGDNGGVRCWGFYDEGKLGYSDHVHPSELGDLPLPGKAVQLSADRHGTSALLDDGRIAAWGDFSEVRAPRPTADAFGLEATRGGRVVQISRGSVANCVVMQGGSVECWLNYRQDAAFVGYGKSWGPGSKAIDLPGPARQVWVSKFKNLMCAVLTDGRLYCWGEGSPERVLGYDRTDDIGDDETPGQVGPVPLKP